MSSKSRPWFKFWVDNWQTSETVRCASWGARGVYVEMLCHQWREGSLPGEPAKIARMIGAPVKLVREIESAFPAGDDGRRRNPKMEEVRCDAEAVSEKRRDSANLRWERERDANALHSGDAKASGLQIQTGYGNGDIIEERGKKKEKGESADSLSLDLDEEDCPF